MGLGGSLRHLHIISSSPDMADRPLGTFTSSGYATNVPSYFRRQSPEYKSDSYTRPNGGGGTNRGSGLEMVEDPTDETRIGNVLNRLSSMVMGFNPNLRRKILNKRKDFSYLQQRFTKLIEESKLDNETKEDYKQRYDKLIKKADEKSEEAIILLKK